MVSNIVRLTPSTLFFSIHNARWFPPSANSPTVVFLSIRPSTTRVADALRIKRPRHLLLQPPPPYPVHITVVARDRWRVNTFEIHTGAIRFHSQKGKWVMSIPHLDQCVNVFLFLRNSREKPNENPCMRGHIRVLRTPQPKLTYDDEENPPHTGRSFFFFDCWLLVHEAKSFGRAGPTGTPLTCLNENKKTCFL